MKRAAIALGGNLGDSATILGQALGELERVKGIKLEAHSQWYQTAAVGPPQPDYLNGCAIVQVDLSPLDLLHKLLEIEQLFGRVRRERWGPRTLDLDLIFYEDLILETPELQIPHPRCRERAFVLLPLAEIVRGNNIPIDRRAQALRPYSNGFCPQCRGELRSPKRYIIRAQVP
ncbi:MAG: 2-amino-4-hydroxy-6-hydroxymethyldihydropteridine diphosphokinase [Microcystis sp. 49638_E5]|uniref:2-amino-4-hydroxy-6- hydroxymethyldihydropteridine diphosphokinase n=1 Tax=Microcystis sp. 49638_E5 TaxID=2904986 RepID=UPI00258377FA|nr:2-amino-4-hydroxy-6-hydroxymethyldihydropteridine diphosphokinase [Microcystis sp. 49638_E5]MCE2668316.1 2-amino-4-hydroxy-6-hydroxymethyldihydropteridine diphosphokinase [Microcystis sp. 49638_E5]